MKCVITSFGMSDSEFKLNYCSVGDRSYFGQESKYLYFHSKSIRFEIEKKSLFESQMFPKLNGRQEFQALFLPPGPGPEILRLRTKSGSEFPDFEMSSNCIYFYPVDRLWLI